MHRWGKLTNGGLVLDVGAENYPFPFALKKNDAGQWYFDSGSAKDEILARRIGGNELSTIDVLNAMAAAQADYFSHPHDGAKAHTYAQKFVSAEGKHDGLSGRSRKGNRAVPRVHWRSSPRAKAIRRKRNPTTVIISGCSPARGRTLMAERNYMVNGSMTGGFAILAYPAEYANSGVMSFLVNPDGIVLQKDLGADTAAIAKTITSFNPDGTWEAVQ